MISHRSIRSNSSRRSSEIVKKCQRQVPRVQIFLDAHLNKAINKIKEQTTQRTNQINKSLPKSKEQQPKQQNLKFPQRKRANSQNFCTFTQNCTLMPNQVVLNYIREVYNKYGIKNPLQGHLDFDKRKEPQFLTFDKYPSFSDKKPLLFQQGVSIKTQKKQRRISQNQAKILQLKNKFKIDEDEQNEQNTIKKINNLSQQQIKSNPRLQSQPGEFIKKSQGNITYIDNLTKLMQSRQIQRQIFDYQNDTTLNQTGTAQQAQYAQQSTPQRSIKHINKFNEGNQQSIQTQTNHLTPNIVKPKKKLFVKTKSRVVSTNLPSHHATPQSNHRQRTNFDLFGDKYKSVKRVFIQQNDLFSNDIKKSNRNHLKIEQDSQVITSFKNSGAQSSNYIPQVYRYCLGCQEAILDSNIVFHERKCSQFNKIYNISFQKLDKIIQKKIENLKIKVFNSQLFNINNKNIYEIKQFTKKWLQQDLTFTNNKKQQQNYKNVEYLLEKNILTGCQLIKKLEWFIKVKNNLQEHLFKSFIKQQRQTVQKSEKYQVQNHIEEKIQMNWK